DLRQVVATHQRRDIRSIREPAVSIRELRPLQKRVSEVTFLLKDLSRRLPCYRTHVNHDLRVQRQPIEGQLVKPIDELSLQLTFRRPKERTRHRHSITCRVFIDVRTVVEYCRPWLTHFRFPRQEIQVLLPHKKRCSENRIWPGPSSSSAMDT